MMNNHLHSTLLTRYACLYKHESTKNRALNKTKFQKYETYDEKIHQGMKSSSISFRLRDKAQRRRHSSNKFIDK